MTSLCLIAITSSSNDQQILNSIVLWLLYVIIYVIYICYDYVSLQFRIVVSCQFCLEVLKVRHPGGDRRGRSWFGYRGRAACHQLRYAKDHRGCEKNSGFLCKFFGKQWKTKENRAHTYVYIYTYTQVMHLYVCISSCSLLQLPFWGLPHFHTQVQQNFEQRPSDARTTHTALDELAEQV